MHLELSRTHKRDAILGRLTDRTIFWSLMGQRDVVLKGRHVCFCKIGTGGPRIEAAAMPAWRDCSMLVGQHIVHAARNQMQRPPDSRPVQ